VPELPEVQAHAERLTTDFAGRVLRRFVPLTFTALKTAVPAPDEAYGQPLREIGRRGKYLLVEFAPVTFVVHLMQGGRLLVDAKQSVKPRGGQARFVFDGEGDAGDSALLLTEQGTERKAGVWCQPTAGVLGAARSTTSVLRPTTSSRTSCSRCSAASRCDCTGSCATSAASPVSADGWPTRCATGRSCRRSR